MDMDTGPTVPPSESNTRDSTNITNPPCSQYDSDPSLRPTVSINESVHNTEPSRPPTTPEIVNDSTIIPQTFRAPTAPPSQSNTFTRPPTFRVPTVFSFQSNIFDLPPQIPSYV